MSNEKRDQQRWNERFDIATRKSSKLDHYKYTLIYVVANLGWLM